MNSTAFHDLPPQAFPVTLEIFELSTPQGGEPVWQCRVEEPGVVQIPGFGRPMRTRLVYGDGNEAVIPPWGGRLFAPWGQR